MISLLSVFNFISLFLLSFISPRQEKQEWKLNGYAQGTTYSIIYYHDQELVKNKEIDSILDQIDLSMSLYKKGSLINQFNASAKRGKLDEHFKKVIVKSLEVFKVSGGYFDITVEPLVQAWGFGAQKADSLPADATIKKTLKHVGSQKLYLNQNGDYLYKTDPEVKIDLNGIAQGYSVDVLADYLESKGIKDYMVEVGGEIRVKGRKSDAQKFSLGIQSPGNNFDDGSMETIVQLPAGALTTSGNYRKFYMNNKRRMSHLIDPKTGYPLQNEMISATVFANDAITADGYDNVFMGMGIKKSLEFLKHHREMEVYFIYQKKDGSVADTASAGFYKFITPNNSK
ncbi:MAG: FAD:protein transferase [Mucilaginibacter sp.]|nr:FAD:protein transferase [Mucilaginibacter sp.]